MSEETENQRGYKSAQLHWASASDPEHTVLDPAAPCSSPSPIWLPAFASSALRDGQTPSGGGGVTDLSVPGPHQRYSFGSGSTSPSMPWSITPTEVETLPSLSSKTGSSHRPLHSSGVHLIQWCCPPGEKIYLYQLCMWFGIAGSLCLRSVSFPPFPSRWVCRSLPSQASPVLWVALREGRAPAPEGTSPSPHGTHSRQLRAGLEKWPTLYPIHPVGYTESNISSGGLCRNPGWGEKSRGFYIQFVFKIGCLWSPKKVNGFKILPPVKKCSGKLKWLVNQNFEPNLYNISKNFQF